MIRRFPVAVATCTFVAHLALAVAFAVAFAVGFAGCSSSAPSIPSTLPAASPDAARKTVTYLASPELEGRGLGTAGLDCAAEYIAGYFKGLGLNPPPGQDSYFQPFTFKTISGLAPESFLVLAGTQLRPSTDFHPEASSAEGAFSGPVVFAGYGVAATADRDGEPIAYDDYAGLDVRGKVVLVLRFEPTDDEGNSRLDKEGFSEHAALRAKAKLAASHGAVALLYVHPPDRHGDERVGGPINRREGQGLSPIPVLQVSQKAAEALLKAAGAPDLRALQRHVNDRFAPRSFELRADGRADGQAVTAEGRMALRRTTYDLRNVTAHLPGKGPLKDQFIVVGAHYDHLGRGGPGSLAFFSRDVHPGADDNASGTAALLEVARILKAVGPLPRSILFVAFSGEERGLLGSAHWVDQPPVPLSSVVAMINLDMVGRSRDDSVVVAGVRTAAPFEDLVRRLDERSPLKLLGVGAPATRPRSGSRGDWGDGLAPSDITSFVLRRIPGLMFYTGVHVDYHRPTDTADKVNYEGLARIADLTAATVVELSRIPAADLAFTAPPPPATGPAASGPSTRPAARSDSGHLRPGGASLGVMPDYGRELPEGAPAGVLLAGASPGSAAERAGLKPGDVLTHFDGQRLESLEDFMDALNKAVPNKPVKLKVYRQGKTIELDATPTPRRARPVE